MILDQRSLEGSEVDSHVSRRSKLGFDIASLVYGHPKPSEQSSVNKENKGLFSTSPERFHPYKKFDKTGHKDKDSNGENEDERQHNGRSSLSPHADDTTQAQFAGVTNRLQADVRTAIPTIPQLPYPYPYHAGLASHNAQLLDPAFLQAVAVAASSGLGHVPGPNVAIPASVANPYIQSTSPHHPSQIPSTAMTAEALAQHSSPFAMLPHRAAYNPWLLRESALSRSFHPSACSGEKTFQFL